VQAPNAPVAPALLLPPAVGSTSSHLRPYDNKYDYAINNCHTYANNGVIEGGGNVGILRCNYQVGRNDGGHTFNYRVEPTAAGGLQVVFYNYGSTCSVPVDANQVVNGTPNIDRADPALLACLSQYCTAANVAGSTWTVVPVGQLDDVPGYAACVRLAIHGHSGNLNAIVDFSDPAVQAQRRTACNTCCGTRVTNLTNWNYPAAQVTQYSNLCNANCNGFFSPPPSPPPSPVQSFATGFLNGLTGGLISYLW
jgi:hypothetical protein